MGNNLDNSPPIYTVVVNALGGQNRDYAPCIGHLTNGSMVHTNIGALSIQFYSCLNIFNRPATFENL